jgi:hypothetical protein
MMLFELGNAEKINGIDNLYRSANDYKLKIE